MSIFEAILQGLIQGFTEFLPVSSSGHLSLFQHFTGQNGDAGLTASIFFHIGTLIAVFIAFWDKIKALIIEFFRMISDIFTGKFKWKEMSLDRRFIIMIVISILPLFAFYIFKDLFEGFSTDNDIIVEGIAFLYTSALLFLSSHKSKKYLGKKDAGEATVKDALIIGVFQGIALTPGISRSGSTISAGIFSGLKKESAIEYSFILGIPVILASALLETKDIIETNAVIEWVPLLIGMAVAAVSGFFAIKLIKWLMKTDKFVIFAFYTLVLGIVVTGLGICEYAFNWRLVF